MIKAYLISIILKKSEKELLLREYKDEDINNNNNNNNKIPIKQKIINYLKKIDYTINK